MTDWSSGEQTDSEGAFFGGIDLTGSGRSVSGGVEFEEGVSK